MTVPEPSAREWLRRLDEGELSARDLVERVLARLDAASPLNALVARDDDAALRAAKAADAARRRGERRPLLGLPLTIKDSLATASLPTASGSWARAGHLPRADATVVARVRSAGAIVVGKTNVPEYTWSYETENALFGRTLNPHDPARTCGGSSGGEAALLGADAPRLRGSAPTAAARSACRATTAAPSGSGRRRASCRRPAAGRPPVTPACST